MFNKQDLSVGAWIVFWILMAIPLVNIIMFLIILFSSDKNPTLRNMLWAQVVLVVIVIVLFLTILSSFTPMIRDLLQEIMSYI